MLHRPFLLLTLAIATATTASAELSLPNFFSDHMVLQRERDVAIWGTSTPGSSISIELADRKATATTDSDGNWKATIKTGEADSDGTTLTVTSGNNSLTIRDVLIGEVWLASGQSNMVFTMNRVPAYSDLIAKSDHPTIRMFNAEQTTAVEPQTDIEGQWHVCSPSTAPSYSAVAFFFARKLNQDLGVPVGILKTAWGGKPVETFTSRKALKTLPGTKALVDAAIEADKTYDADRAKVAYEARMDQWKAAMDDFRKKPAEGRGRAPRRPAAPKRPLNTEGKPGVLFNGMIHPFIGYTMQGAIWYQGEANAKAGHVPYDETLPLMIRDWRSRWNDDFSFYFVQLANFRTPSTEPGTADPWALLQDRMRRILDTTPKTGMATINDVGEANDIHPKNKKDPGERLARWALAKDYGQAIVYSGPLYKSNEKVAGAIRITFEQAGDGLKTRDGEDLARFEIAGKDQSWHWAEATIEGTDTVRVSSPDVPSPVAVRYAWASNPEGANLVNSEGLPASIFRTDDWEDVEAPSEADKALTLRREIGEQIRALNTKRANFKRGSDAFKENVEKRNELMEKFRSLAPKS